MRSVRQDIQSIPKPSPLQIAAIAHSEHAFQESIATAASPPTASLFDNLGNHHHPISTRNSLTQRYFDQGLILSYLLRSP